jgi:sterol desaturase/sphingolipid hydroxylase (fatty acid hydroxylase superfamily)
MPASSASAIQVVTKLILAAVITNSVFQGFLSSLLSIVTSLGIILHMFLVKLNYPVELMNFFAIIFPLITFDAIPVAGLYENWFHFSEISTDHALTDQFSTVGYSSMYLV